MGGWALFSPPVWRWWLLAAGLFSALAAMAVGINAEWLAALDISAESWLEGHSMRGHLVDAKHVFVSIGQPVYAASVALVCGSLLSLRARSAVPVVLVVGGVGFGVVVERLLKEAVVRTSTAVAELQGQQNLLRYEHAFPSGHVTVSAALFGMIAVCIGVWQSRAVRVALAVLVAASVALIAMLAVYATAHVFTDVIGGMLLGGAIVSLGAAVLGATHYSRRDSAVAPTGDP